MADRTVSVELLAKLTGYTSQTTAAAGATDKLADSMVRAASAQKTLEGAQRQAVAASTASTKAAVANASAQRKQLEALTTVGKGFLTLGAIAGIGLGLAAKATLDFNKQMALVGTLAKANPAQLSQLSAAALTVGQRYGYTATQVASAQAELIKAGLSTKQVLGGALVGSLTLAAAAQTDVATATTLAVSAMTQFGLKAGAIPHIADLLAAGADKALGSAVDLGQGLDHVGTTAHQFGFSIEETTGVLALLAQNGQIGSKAGTELNQALLQLAATTPQAQALMDKYGISLYDANGNTKSLADFSDNLKSSLSGLTTEQRNAALATIFGSRAIRAANVLYEGGGAAVRDWTAKVNDAGFASQQATGKLDSLAGDLQKFKAAFQTGLIEEGDASTGPLRGVVQDVTKLVDLFDNASPVVKTLIFDLTAGATAFGLIGGAAFIAVPKIVAFQAALATLRGTAETTAVALDAEAEAEAAAGAGAAGGSLLSRVGSVGRAAGPIGALVGGLLIGKQLIDTSVADRVASQTATLSNDPKKLATAQERLGTLGFQLNQAKAARAALPGAASAQRGVSSGNVAALQGQYDTLAKEVAAATKAQAANKKAAAESATANDTLASSMTLVSGTLVKSTFDVTQFDAQLKGLSSAFDVKALTDQLTEGFQSLGKQIKANGSATKGNSAAALANRDALRQQYKTAVQIIQTYADQTDASGHAVHSADQVQAKAKEVTKQFKSQAHQAGLTAGQVKAYVDKLNSVPAKVDSDITLTGLTSASNKMATLLGYLQSIDGKTFEAQVNAQVNFQRGSGVPGVGIRAPSELNTQPSRTPKGNGGSGYTGGTYANGHFYSDGGSVFGGPPGRDTVPAFLDNGEEVISKGPAATFRPLLKAINATGFAAGGTVGTPDLSTIFGLLTTTNSKGKSIASTLGAQFGNAAGRTAKVDATFVRNLDIIAAKGFGFLAMQLLDSGDANAKAIAAKATRWSTSHLRAVQSSLQKDAASQKTLGLLPAELAISSALKTGKNPTLSSIAAATGLDPSDLQAGLIAMQKSLKGNRNAGALLSGLNSTGVYSQSSWGATTAASGPQFTVVIPKASKNPYSTGEKIAMGANRVLAASSGNQSMPRW